MKRLLFILLLLLPTPCFAQGLSAIPSVIFSTVNGTYGNNGPFWAYNEVGAQNCTGPTPVFQLNQIPANTSVNFDYTTSINLYCGYVDMVIGQQFGGDLNGAQIPAGALVPTPIAIDSASALTLTYTTIFSGISAATNANNNGAGIELYPSTTPGRSGHNLSVEISINIHSSAQNYNYWGGGGCTLTCTTISYSSACYTGTITLDTSGTNGGLTPQGHILTYLTGNADHFSGCIDVLGILKAAETGGLLNSGLYVNGIEFGFEPAAAGIGGVDPNVGNWTLQHEIINWNGTSYGN